MQTERPKKKTWVKVQEKIANKEDNKQRHAANRANERSRVVEVEVQKEEPKQKKLEDFDQNLLLNWYLRGNALFGDVVTSLKGYEGTVYTFQRWTLASFDKKNRLAQTTDGRTLRLEEADRDSYFAKVEFPALA